MHAYLETYVPADTHQSCQTKRAKPPPKSAAQSIPVESGEHVQEFKVKWSTTKKFYTEAVKELVSVNWQSFERFLC